jgi:hypothetical protein
MTNAAFERYLLLAGGAVLLIYVMAKNGEGIAKGAASGIVTAAGNAVVGTFAGIGQGINDSLINPAVQKLSGQQDATLGTWLYDVTHPNDPANHITDPVFVGGGGTFDPSAGATGSW